MTAADVTERSADHSRPGECVNLGSGPASLPHSLEDNCSAGAGTTSRLPAYLIRLFGGCSEASCQMPARGLTAILDPDGVNIYGGRPDVVTTITPVRPHLWGPHIRHNAVSKLREI
jgi:hypothetical protein